MNNDNDLNLHSMTKLSGWLRYWWPVGGWCDPLKSRKQELTLYKSNVKCNKVVLLVLHYW